MYVSPVIYFFLSPLPSSYVLLDCNRNHPVRYNCWDPICHCSDSVWLQERLDVVLLKEYLGTLEHCGTGFIHAVGKNVSKVVSLCAASQNCCYS